MTASNSDKLQMMSKTLHEWLNDIQLSFVVSNPREPDNVIVYASERFFQVTGYSPAEVLGKNCRFLQGMDCS